MLPVALSTHPDGHSTLCNRDSCLNVGISAEGHSRILDHLLPQRLAWGTDANAYSQMALDYFTQDFDNYDEDSDCQINYVIVIGDGMWRNHDSARDRIEALRQDFGVKTVFIAYGDNIKGTGLDQFKDMAVAGSCDAKGGEDCRDLIGTVRS